MPSVADIKAPIANELKIFEEHFKNSLKSKVSLLDKITHYIIKRKGKQMRPMFVFLCAKLNGEINENTYTAASLIELLHTATLVHDDVVDDSSHRRGFFSLNALWKNKIAVLVGDYLLSRGLLLSVEKGQFQLLGIVSKAVQEMSEGELLQMEKARKLNIDEAQYYEIIRQKTASLIAACCAAGSASVNVTDEQQSKMYEFGEKVGMAFQIKDDLFDYQIMNKTGKPTGIDIKERKMTLPLIYALNNADKKERRWLINSVKKHNENKTRVREVMEYVRNSGGINYATEVMNKYAQEALLLLDNFSDSTAKASLESLVNYTIAREK
ncbi:MAG: polyprenyl synthetase family protein [Flavobacteriales bacterium]